MITTVTINAKNYARRIQRMKHKIETQGSATTRQIATQVANRARLYAPKASGKTADFIKIIPLKLTKDEKSYAVGYENNGFGSGNPHPEKTYDEGKEFSLPLWMHTSSNAKSHPWKNGYPDFLYKASRETRKEFETQVRKVVHDALLIKVK